MQSFTLISVAVTCFLPTVSLAAVKELNLEVGKEAYAIIKATSVMVGVE